jgi:hypothetical protein
MPVTASTLTLGPCHKAQAEPVRPHTGLERMTEIACEGLTITPDQLRAEPTEGGDIPDLVSGALTSKALRLTARTLALMRYSGPSEPCVVGTTVYDMQAVFEKGSESVPDLSEY